MSNALNTNRCRILSVRLGGHFHSAEFYNQIEEWVVSVPGAHFDRARGITYLNGRVYFTDIFFDNEEDMLACKLKFAGQVV